MAVIKNPYDAAWGESVDLSKVKGYQGLKGPEREPELRRILKFRALNGLKYYPSEDVYNAILPLTNDEDGSKQNNEEVVKIKKRFKWFLQKDNSY